MLLMKERRPAFRTTEGWTRSVPLEAGAIRECAEHGWMRDRGGPHGAVIIEGLIPLSSQTTLWSR
jgi:hypothetical protein